MKDPMNIFFGGLADFTEEVPVPQKEEGSEPVIEEVADPEQIPTKERQVEVQVNVGEEPKQDGQTIDREKSRTEDQANSTETAKLLRELNYATRAAEGMQRGHIFQGNEDYGNFISNSLYGVVNVFGHIVNMAGTLLTRSFADFKRGELTEYLGSNITLMSRINDTSNYDIVKNLLIFTPRGMQGNFKDATKSLLKFLDVVKMPEYVKSIKSVFADMAKAIEKDNKSSFDRTVVSVSKMVNLTEADKAFNASNKFFTQRTNDKDAFRKQFSSMEDFCDFVSLVKDSEIHLRYVISVNDSLKDIEKSLEHIYAAGKNIDKNQLNTLVKSIRLLAGSFENYSTVIDDLSRVGHNTLLNIMKVRKELNYIN